MPARVHPKCATLSAVGSVMQHLDQMRVLARPQAKLKTHHAEIAAEKPEHVSRAFDGPPGLSAQELRWMRANLAAKSLKLAGKTVRRERVHVRPTARGRALVNAPQEGSARPHKHKHNRAVCAVIRSRPATTIVFGRMPARAATKVYATPTILIFQRKFLDVMMPWTVRVCAVEAIRAARVTRAFANGTAGMHATFSQQRKPVEMGWIKTATESTQPIPMITNRIILAQPVPSYLRRPIQTE